MVATSRPTTSRDLLRLAAQADGLGLTVYRDKRGADEYLVPSASRKGMNHFVTVRGGCDCEGYGRHQRCTHYALVLAELGMLPEEPEPTPPAPAAAALPSPPAEQQPDPWAPAPDRLTRLTERAARYAAAADRGHLTMADCRADGDDAAAEARGFERDAKRERDADSQRYQWRCAARYWTAAAQALAEAGEPQLQEQAERDARRCNSLAAAAGANVRYLRATAEDRTAAERAAA